MPVWQGALLCAALSAIGVSATRRWLNRSPYLWEWLLCTAAGALLGGMLTIGSDAAAATSSVTLAAVLLTVLLVNLNTLLIPNGLVLAGLILGAGLRLAGPTQAWASGGLGAAAIFGVLLALELGLRGSVGMGTVKLGAVIGLFLGWPGAGIALLIAAAATGVLMFVWAAQGREQVGELLPVVPSLAIGVLLQRFLDPLPFSPLYMVAVAAAFVALALLLRSPLRRFLPLPRRVVRTFVHHAGAPDRTWVALFEDDGRSGRFYLYTMAPGLRLGTAVDSLHIYDKVEPPVQAARSVRVLWKADSSAAVLVVDGAIWGVLDLGAGRKLAGTVRAGSLTPIPKALVDRGLSAEEGEPLCLEEPTA